MEHISEQTWVDVVRGVSSLATAQEIGTHLETCSKCRTTLQFWGDIRNLTANENHCAPPENLVRLLKLEFASQQSQPETSAIANLIFDSAAHALPASVRGGAVTTRQFVYEAEGLTVDLRFERVPHSSTISASGQVLDRQAPLCWMGNATIVLWTDKGRMLTTAEANEYGEFQFEFEANDQLRISIATEGRRTLRIPLGNLS